MQPLADFAPLYAQIAAEIRAEIASGHFPPGTKIPAEQELASRFRVGRPTVRQATQLLVTDGVLQRRRGSGTYVRAAEPKLDLLSACGTLDSLARSGVVTTSHVLGNAVKVWPPKQAHPEFSFQEAFWLRRLSSVKDVPVLLEEVYFSSHVFPDLDNIEINNRSLSLLARDDFGLVASAIEQRFRVAALDAARAELLALNEGVHVLVVERTVHFTRAPNAVFSVLYCRTDQAEFSQRLELDKPGTAAVPVPVYEIPKN